MADFKTVMWNCAGLRASTATTQNKLIALEQVTNKNFELLILLETHHRNEEDIPMDIKRFSNKYHILHTPVTEGEHSTGIIILIDKTYEIINHRTLIEGRLLNLKIRHTQTNKEYNISALYAYTNNTFYKTKAEALVEKLLQVHQISDTNIILGDFNFIDNALDKRAGLNKIGKTINLVWQKFLQELNIEDPFRKSKPKLRQYSFIGKDGSSRIDSLYK